MIHVDRYEKIWIYVAVAMLLIFGAAITVSAFATGIQLPSPEMRVDPRLVATPGATSFGEPGLRELAPGKFEARILAQTWSFKPNEIKVKAGSKITFYVTSKDVIHGFHIDETNVNFRRLAHRRPPPCKPSSNACAPSTRRASRSSW